MFCELEEVLPDTLHDFLPHHLSNCASCRGSCESNAEAKEERCLFQAHWPVRIFPAERRLWLYQFCPEPTSVGCSGSGVAHPRHK